MSPRNVILLILLCLLLYLPGITKIPPLDRDESRFAQASKQMIESGDYVDIRFQTKPRYKKPIGAYWLQTISVHALSEDKLSEIWAYRIPSVIAATIAVILTYLIANLFIAQTFSLIAASLLASCFLLVAEAHMAKTDAMLLAAILAAQFGLARAYKGLQGIKTWLFFWLGMGTGILIKGPIAPLIIGLTIAYLFVTDRKFSWFRNVRPMLGVLIAGIIVFPWLILIEIHSDGNFLKSSIGDDFVPKLLSGIESHGSPPGYYILLVMVCFWPASLFLWPALINTWNKRQEPGIKFLVAWLVPAWILFELVPTKLPHYVLPLYPAIAIIIATWIGNFSNFSQDKCGKPLLFPPGTVFFSYFWLAIGLLIGIGTLILTTFSIISNVVLMPLNVETFASMTFWGQIKEAFHQHPEVFIPIPFAFLFAIASLISLMKRKIRTTVLLVVTGSAIFFFSFAEFTIPNLDRLFVSSRIAATVDLITDKTDRNLVSVGYHEPSLIFLTGTKTKFLSPKQAAREFATHPHTVVAITRRHWDKFHKRISEQGIKSHLHQTVEGINYSNGRTVKINIVTRASTP